MFDVYSQASMHARTEAYLHSGPHTSWQDVRRQALRDDPEFQAGKTVAAGSLLASLAHLFTQIAGWLAPMRVQHHSHVIYLPLKHHHTHIYAHAHVHARRHHPTHWH